jgi:hypothetical protein
VVVPFLDLAKRQRDDRAVRQRQCLSGIIPRPGQSLAGNGTPVGGNDGGGGESRRNVAIGVQNGFQQPAAVGTPTNGGELGPDVPPPTIVAMTATAACADAAKEDSPSGGGITRFQLLQPSV